MICCTGQGLSNVEIPCTDLMYINISYIVAMMFNVGLNALKPVFVGLQLLFAF